MFEKLISIENQEKIAVDLIRRSIEISNNTQHDIFCHYYPHCSKIQIWVHRGGWEQGVSGIMYDIHFDAEFYNPSEDIKLIKAVLDELEKDIVK